MIILINYRLCGKNAKSWTIIGGRIKRRLDLVYRSHPCKGSGETVIINTNTLLLSSPYFTPDFSA